MVPKWSTNPFLIGYFIADSIRRVRRGRGVLSLLSLLFLLYLSYCLLWYTVNSFSYIKIEDLTQKILEMNSRGDTRQTVG